MNPGSIVHLRNRDWVLLPSDNPDIRLLRPLTGATDDVVAIHQGLSDLIGATIPQERIRPSAFPPPTEDDLSDAAGAPLLWQAARLTLREGATPFRSLGRISIRPRIYQFVPLLMALRLDPVRLLIADDLFLLRRRQAQRLGVALDLASPERFPVLTLDFLGQSESAPRAAPW